VHLLLAPAGTGKTTTLVQLVNARTAAATAAGPCGVDGGEAGAGSRPVSVPRVAAAVNATGTAFARAWAKTAAADPEGPDLVPPLVQTFNGLARDLVGVCRVAGPGVDMARAPSVGAVWPPNGLQLLAGLVGILDSEESTWSREAAVKYFTAPGDAVDKRVTGAVGRAVARGATPPEAVTLRGAYVRWCGAGRDPSTGPDSPWATYVARVLVPLGFWGRGVVPGGPVPASAAGPPPGPGAKAPRRVRAYDWMAAWAATAAVTHGVRDMYGNVHRLELAWFPDRFDLAAARGPPLHLSTLAVDEAQDTPQPEAAYLVRLALAAGLELWWAGDPHQQIFDFANSANALGPRAQAAAATVHTLATNYRCPQEVWAATAARVQGLFPVTLAVPGGTVEFVKGGLGAVGGLEGCLVLFRSNKGLMYAAARAALAPDAPRVFASKFWLQRLRGAQSLWFSRHKGASSGKAAAPDADDPAAADDDDGGDGGYGGDGDGDDAGDDDDANVMVAAMRAAPPALAAVLRTTPETWVTPVDDGAIVGDVPLPTPYYSTVHGFKGQGHADVVLAPGIVDHTGDTWTTDDRHGRLVYVAMTRSSARLRVCVKD
jgi:hypothetical protein